MHCGGQHDRNFDRCIVSNGTNNAIFQKMYFMARVFSWHLSKKMSLVSILR